MKKLWLFISIGGALFGILLRFVVTVQGGNKHFSFKQKGDTYTSIAKIYVANEGDGTISIIDTKSKIVVKTIDLSQQYYGKYLRYAPHNVQVSPDGKIILVTANILTKEGGHSKNVNNDQLIFIDPMIDEISGRMDIGIDAHLAHVVIHPTKPLAYIVGGEKSVIYEVDFTQMAIIQTIILPKNASPHGVRLSPDGSILYIAFMEGRAIGQMDTISHIVDIIPVPGKAVQVAVTQDHRYVLASLYDTKSIARYDVITKNINILQLPTDTYGPIQLYPTPDNMFVYVADQGYYFDQPVSNKIYKIDLEKFQITQHYTGSAGPHGVVVDLDGEYAYITNIIDNTVSVIDIAQDKIIDNIAVGSMPNGISIWTPGQGGTP